MKRQFACLVAIALALVAPLTATAIEVHPSDEPMSESRTINDDYLYAGETLGFSGVVDSLFFVGKSLTMSGETRGNLIAMGETLTANGTVGDDAIVAGRTVNISGRLGSTSFLAGNNVSVLSGAEAAGALFAGANDLYVAGTINGDLYAGARKITIAGRVNGDVHIGAEHIILEEGAVITGDLEYYSDRELSDSETAAVRGETIRREQVHEMTWKPTSWFWRLGKWIISLILTLSALVFTMVFYAFPGLRHADTDRGHRRFWTTVVWGLIPFFGYPVLIGALFFGGILFGITVPIALALVTSLGMLSFVLMAFALPQIGNYISVLFRWNLHQRGERAVFLRTLVGAAVSFVLGLVPFLNGLAFVAILSLGWGVALERLFNRRFAVSQQ